MLAMELRRSSDRPLGHRNIHDVPAAVIVPELVTMPRGITLPSIFSGGADVGIVERAGVEERCWRPQRRSCPVGYACAASYAQVTEKLYDLSRYRYRAYRDELQPVIPILEPVTRPLAYR
jgi:hypothetical protein